MSPANPPNSDDTSSASSGKPMRDLGGVEMLLQLGLLLPAALVIGWAIGLALDRWLGTHWINIAGVIAGAIAGLVQTVRIALSHGKK